MNFTVKFTESNAKFIAGFNENSFDFTSAFNANTLPFEVSFRQSCGSVYEGEYEVTPKVTEQVLATAHTVMEQDLTVLSIPYYDVSNASGGSTVYIGNEV